MNARLFRYVSVGAMLALSLGSALPTQAALPAAKKVAGTVIYDRLNLPLPPSEPSQAFQATETTEFGDHVIFAGSARSLTKVTFVMVTWAYQSQFPSMIDPSGWTHPFKLNLYNVVPGSPPTIGTVIATVSQNLRVPWRPEPSPACSDNKWQAGDGSCNNGMAFEMSFDLTALNITVPNEIIYGLAYNTQSWGSPAIGTPGPYDSLNVGVGATAATIGTDVNDDAVFMKSTWAGNYCDLGVAGTGTFRFDGGCWKLNPPPFNNMVPNARFEAITPADLNIVPSVTTVPSGSPVNVELRIDGATSLVGYEFTLNYPAAMATAPGTGSYANTFLTASSPAGVFNAKPGTCVAAGTCEFAQSLFGVPAGVTGSGPLATVSFIANTPGTYLLTYSFVALSDYGETPSSLPVVLHTATIIVVPGSATVNGTIRLQARATPITAGPVTLVQQSAPFATFSTTYDPTTGFFSRAVDAVAAGTTYKLTAGHQNYLNDEKTLTVYPNNTYPQTQATSLRAGDAYQDGLIDIGDLSCVGAGFGLAVAPCGLGGTTDINGDTVVNIFDLVLVGGNYGLTAPQPY